MFEVEIWNYRNAADRGIELAGFGVEAIDGSIGKVDSASYDLDSSAIVVDTGPWIFGRKVMLPAGLIDRIDFDDEKVYVHRTKDEIKAAPEYDESIAPDAAYRNRLGRYYGPNGTGYRSLEPPVRSRW